MAGEPVLELNEVQKTFGGLVAIDYLSASFYDNETIGIIGPNGAGKTTLFHLITGILQPTSGSILYRGEHIEGKKPEERVRMGIGRSFQITNIFSEFTVYDNVHIAVQSEHGHNLNVTDSYRTVGDTYDRTMEILDQLNLVAEQDTVASNLSYGDKRVLEIGITLGLEPELLLLDEPTAGMSDDETERVLSLIEELGEDRTILYIEHNLDAVLDISDRILVLDQGRRVEFDQPEAIQANSRVQEIYVDSRGEA